MRFTIGETEANAFRHQKYSLSFIFDTSVEINQSSSGWIIIYHNLQLCFNERVREYTYSLFQGIF